MNIDSHQGAAQEDASTTDAHHGSTVAHQKKIYKNLGHESLSLALALKLHEAEQRNDGCESRPCVAPRGAVEQDGRDQSLWGTTVSC